MNDHNNRGNCTTPSRRGLFHRLLMTLPAESAHNLAVTSLRLAQATPLRKAIERKYQPPSSGLDQALAGLSFRGPIGLAAGFDKDGLVVPGMAALGFGWLEVGAVTPRPQKGNPKPRLFRHRRERSLENAMGFNNRGGEQLADRLAGVYPARVPLFVNLGKNRDTPNGRASDDYLELIGLLEENADGFVLNVSSPNTPGLRDLGRGDEVSVLVRRCREATARPLFVKLSPDGELAEIVATARMCAEAGANGIILANTTIDYSLLGGARRVGGLSGQVLKERSFELLEAVAGDLFGRCLLISVGGVSTARDVYRRIRAGAHLVQLYTALVYEGPGLVARLNGELGRLLLADGFGTLAEAVGADQN